MTSSLYTELDEQDIVVIFENCSMMKIVLFYEVMTCLKGELINCEVL